MLTCVVLFLTGCSGNKVKIVAAVYGAGANFADVSDQVNKMLGLNMQFNAQPSFLKADPLPGWNKTLVIVYGVNGRHHIFSIGEGGNVSNEVLSEAATH
jgi:hypothetical protein